MIGFSTSLARPLWACSRPSRRTRFAIKALKLAPLPHASARTMRGSRCVPSG